MQERLRAVHENANWHVATVKNLQNDRQTPVGTTKEDRDLDKKYL